MADNTTRTVAEKLAAAKKKHKAYLKEKALKNVTESKHHETKNITQYSEESKGKYEESYENHTNESVNVEKQDPSESNEYEASLPLPQFSMENNYQASSLPDPLSFFDNFKYTNVGTTLQNFTQPLTNFFNNSDRNESDCLMELPNQILIEESSINNMNISNENNSQIGPSSNITDTTRQEFFSYDKFKINAIKDVSEQKSQEDVNNMQEFVNNTTFDQFTNIAADFHSRTTNFGHSNLEEFIPNVSHISPELNIQNVVKEPKAIFELEPKLEIVTNDSNKIQLNVESINTAIEPPSSSPSILNLSNEMENYIKEEQNVQGYTNIPPTQVLEEKDQELIDEQNYPNIPQSQVLEERDQELMKLIEKQNAKCIELSQKLYDSEIKYAKLETDHRNLISEMDSNFKSSNDNEMINDLTKLREDLQCHLQTIGMLVAEKTELSTLLQETQTEFRNESSQCIDLQNEIKELKIYYSDLEHELQTLKSEKVNMDSCQKQQAGQFEKIQKELTETKTQCEGLTQDLLEAREKLKAVTAINASLQKQIQELTSQHSMANIKIQQLTLQESSHLENQIKQLLEEKVLYEKQITMLNDTLKTNSKEREECSLQYQQYAEQLNDQISNLVQQLEQQQKEYEQLKIQEENRIKHIGDLEKQLQSIQSDQASYNLQRNNSFYKKELESSTELAQNLQAEKEQLNMNYMKVLSEKDMLEKEVEGYKISISQLESTVEQLKGNLPDNAVLLATMESDKVAASRAISQNKDLKQQMEGMQEVMFKVNNDNVQLTEIVSIERKTNRDLLEKLQKTEISFQTLAEAIEIKDKELLHLRDQIESLSKQIVHQEQLSDRLRHYEAQNHSSPSLQVELQEAKQMIAHLTNELNIMKRNQLNQTSQMSQTIPVGQVNQMNQTVEIDPVYQSSTIEQTNYKNQTNDRELVNNEHGTINTDIMNELRAQLSNLQIRNKELEIMLQNVQSAGQKAVDANGNEHLDKNTAMMHLEKKFLRTMEEIARLTEEKQRLEHLVLQLQGETETIGEYVTLYQQQRSILKQRALEKDQQLQQLTNDRESMKANLERLNNLVKNLIVSKGAIPKELLDEHEHFSKDRNDLCTEHQKIHQEINKITSNGLNDMGLTNDANKEIAEEIINLLSEIKSSNLVQPNEDSIHHCAWCSGKLITI